MTTLMQTTSPRRRQRRHQNRTGSSRRTIHPAKVVLQWPQRAKRKTTSVGKYRKFVTRCGKFAICECVSRFGLGRQWLAIRRLDNGNELVISKHRKKETAIAAVEKFARANSQ